MEGASSNEESITTSSESTSRRKVLATVGAGISFAGLASADSFPKQLTLYLHLHEGCSGKDYDVALSGANKFRDQFNDYFDGFEMSVHSQPNWSGNDSRNYIENNWSSIPDIVNPSGGDGIHHFLVSDFFNDIGASDHGYGHSIRNLTSDYNGATVTNVGAIRSIDGRGPAKNLVIHETLHSLNVGHQHGKVSTKSIGGGNYAYTNVSPMATSYVRSSIIPGTSDITFKGTGFTPDEFCNGTNNNKAITFAGDHTTTISWCSFDQVNDHLQSEYDVDYPDDGGCGSVQPCPTSQKGTTNDNSSTDSQKSPP